MNKCGKCGGRMKLGRALQNTPAFGPTASLKEDKRGQTYTLTGPPKLVQAFKCSECGYTLLCK